MLISLYYIFHLISSIFSSLPTFVTVRHYPRSPYYSSLFSLFVKTTNTHTYTYTFRLFNKETLLPYLLKEVDGGKKVHQHYHFVHVHCFTGTQTDWWNCTRIAGAPDFEVQLTTSSSSSSTDLINERVFHHHSSNSITTFEPKGKPLKYHQHSNYR